jgi:hypothetical protein
VPVLLSAANNVARFDHNPVTGESLGLLIEEQRTNLFTYSSEFDDAAWVKSQASITANTVVAPDGTLTGDKLVENTATAFRSAQQSISGVSGTIYTITVYAKAAERTLLRLGSPSSIFGTSATWQYDLTTGSVTTVAGTAGTSASAELVGNGWWRVRLTTIAATTTTTGSFTISLSTAGGGSYTGDGYSGLYIWGAQLEAGAFPTSYIPTVASQVTRSNDVASMTGANFSSWFNNAEGTLYAEANTPDNTGTFLRVAALSDGSAGTNVVYLAKSAGNARAFVVTNGVTQFSSNQGAWSGFGKFAVVYKTNDAASVFNGGSAATGSSVVLPLINQIDIGRKAIGAGNELNGHIRKVSYYPIRITNVELQALTQI